MASPRRAPGRRSGMNRRKSAKGAPMAGTRLELRVENVAHGGHCVARHEGRVVFVRHTLPGERVIARVSEGTTESAFLRADAIEIIEPSPDRVDPPCPYSGPGMCGGCDWQHASLDAQRRLKGQVVSEQLRRIAHVERDVEVEAMATHTDGLRWRTRLELAVRDGRAGLRRHRSHDLVEIEDCLIADEAFLPALNDRFAPDVTGLDLVHPSVGDIIGVELPQPKGEVTPAVTQVVPFQGRDYGYEVGARGFWQVHPSAAPTFLEAVMKAAAPQPGETCLDLYCGVGLFTRPLADAVGPSGHVLGVEADADAVGHARVNMGGARHVDLVAADVEKVPFGVGTADVVVLDPPRAGAGRIVMERVATLAPRTIVYVACDPAALARDVGYAAERGYTMTALRAFDAFPMTQHVECIAVLTPAEG